MSKQPKPVPYKCHVCDDPDGNRPDFIYGGPFFVPSKKEDRLMDLNTPTNLPHLETYNTYNVGREKKTKNTKNNFIKV